jgi:hypothetical protein
MVPKPLIQSSARVHISFSCNIVHVVVSMFKESIIIPTLHSYDS